MFYYYLTLKTALSQILKVQFFHYFTYIIVLLREFHILELQEILLQILLSEFYV